MELGRDHNGAFVRAKTVATSGSPNPREAKAWALLQALKWIPQLDLTEIVIEFESDYKTVVDVLHTRFKGASEFFILYMKNLVNLPLNSPDKKRVG